MTSKISKKGVDKWREYFRRTSSDIFDIIEHAIMVAAIDCPQEYRVRRDKIAELLFSCRFTRCLGCDHVELALSDCFNDDVNVVINGVNHDHHHDHDDHVGGDGGGSKGSKVNSITRENDFNDDGDDGGDGDDGDDDGGDGDEMINMVNNEINFSYGDAEALTDEIEEVKGVVDEVYRIKDILNNSQDESDSVLFDSLRRLQLMALTYDILKTTEIGKAVNRIRKHGSKEIRHLARTLIDGWKIIVDEWVKATQDLAGGTPDSVNPSTVDEEEGLPSPPLDEGAFLSTQTMDFSQFFDGMDDDGNPRNCGEINKNMEVRDSRRKPSVVKQDPPKRREFSKQEIPLAKDNKLQQPKRQEPLPQQKKPSNTQSGPGRPVKPNGEQKVVKDARFQQKLGKPNDQRRPPSQPERVRSPNDNAVQEKLEATKRKLQERYQQAENAKRQRTIQVMEIQDIPKQGLTRPNPFSKFGNNRNWANGRK